ncbi:MAG: Hsp20/alpha crystallin family protein [Akkermansiaceae bacterium]
MSDTTFPTERPSFRTRTTDSGLELAVTLPGVPKDQLTVNLENRLLSIKGERRFRKEQNGAENRDYQLAVKLHDDLDPNKIEASHQNGVLKIKLFKRKELAPRQIDILAN